tara:strand:- start:89 stop:322 length:234 start_codon:yes stop_codon:yes gene_type:complete
LKKSLINILIIFLSISFVGCAGWSIMGYALDEEYSPSVFQEIIDQDSIVHYYNSTIYNGKIWCYNHSKYEEVKVVSE